MGAAQTKEDGSVRTTFAQILDPAGIFVEPADGVNTADQLLREKYEDGTLAMSEPGLNIDRVRESISVPPVESPCISLDMDSVNAPPSQSDSVNEEEEYPGLTDPLTGEALMNSAAGIQRVVPKALLSFLEPEKTDVLGEQVYRSSSAGSSSATTQNSTPRLGA